MDVEAVSRDDWCSDENPRIRHKRHSDRSDLSRPFLFGRFSGFSFFLSAEKPGRAG